MGQLSYSDRAKLIDSLASLNKSWFDTDEQLISQVSEWVKKLVPKLGFEQAIVRDIATLSLFLHDKKIPPTLAIIAKGALIYTLKSETDSKLKLKEFWLIDVAFISSYAVNEIYTRMGVKATYSLPKLDSSEQQNAENLFLDFVDEPILDDNSLIHQSRELSNEINNLARCGLFWRMQKNIDFLISVLESSTYENDKKIYARAALSYLVCEDDAIDDRLGIIGYIDDNFILEIAVDLIDPTREPWLDLLDTTINSWPFLNQLVLDDGSGGRPISEYMLINSALSCKEIRDSKDIDSIILITPSIGPIPFLLGFISTLGLIHESGKQDIFEDSFYVGQKVIVDYDAVAEFAGFQIMNGQKWFKLKQYRTEKGMSLHSCEYWPISDLSRLAPIDSSRVTRGSLSKDLKYSNKPLPGLDYLFKTGIMSRIINTKKQILVVTTIHSAQKLASQLKLYGHYLQDVIPIGHITLSETPKSWSTNFGQQEPLLVFVSDLDFACALVEKNIDKFKTVIIDFSARNVNKTASLQRFRHLGIATIVLVNEQDINKINIEDYTSVWQWNEDDFLSLLWLENFSKNNTGPISRYEDRLQIHSSSIEVKCITFPLIDEVVESIWQLKSIIKERKEENLIELDTIHQLVEYIFKRMQRLAIELDENTQFTKSIEITLNKIKEIRENSVFLSEIEISSCKHVETLLGQLFRELKKHNPKATMIKNIVSSYPTICLICPDKILQDDLSKHYVNKASVDLEDEGDLLLNGAIIPGWFGKRQMAKILVPPITKPLFLVLYNFEYQWYRYFERERKKSYYKNLAKTARRKLFPSVQNWKKTNFTINEVQGIQQDKIFKERENIEYQIQDFYKQKIYKEAKANKQEEGTLAYLVNFENGIYAFLTDSYKATVVTHLLDNFYEQEKDTEKAEAKQVSVKDLKLGDALLFHLGSPKDAIISIADQLLPKGTRDKSSLWRKALRKFMQKEKITSKEIWELLKKEGCSLAFLTLKSWLENDSLIAPQKEEHINIIAKVVNDEELLSNLSEVILSVHIVRSTHLKAAHQLASKVLDNATVILKRESTDSKLIEIEKDLVIVRVSEIGEELISVKTSLVNRIQEFKLWHV